MAQIVILKEKVVKYLKPILPFIYPYAHLVGDINGGGSGFSWNGDPASKIKFIRVNPGNDEPMNLQHLSCEIDQQWLMEEITRDITQRRRYRDILDKIYVNEADVMSDEVLVNYLRNVRPVNMSKYVSAKLYEEAVESKKSEMIIEANIDSTNVMQYFDQISRAQMENENFVGLRRTMVMTYDFYAAIKNSDLNKRITMNKEGVISRDVEMIDNIILQPMSKSLLKSKVEKNTKGYPASADAKQIHAILTVDQAVAHPYGIDDIRVDEATALSDNKQVFGNWFSFDVWQHPGYSGYGIGIIVEPSTKSSEINP